MKQAQLYINGNWSNGQKTIQTFNPSTGEVFGKIYSANADEVNQAVIAATNALSDWKNKSVDERISIVGKVVDLIVEEYGKAGEATVLKNLISEEIGKRLPEADIEVIESSDMISFYLKNGKELLKRKTLSLNQELWATKNSQIIFEPVGVVAVIKAWNYPLEIPLWSLVPALISGNTVVFKPSEHSTFVAEYLVKLFEKAGLTPGVLNLVTGDGRTGKHLVQNKGVKMVSFTGSVKTGTEIAVDCASRHVKYSLELGGNDAAIVAADADIELTSNGLIWGAFCNSGQVCTGIKRVFVNEMISENLISEIVIKTKALRKDIDFGPVVSQQQLITIEDFVADAKSKGARVLIGGNRISDSKGYYFEPTVLTNISLDMKIMNEECFGPLLPIYMVKSNDEAVKLANNSNYGLGASVWTSDNNIGERIAEQLEVGMVWVNDVNVAFPEAPWTATKYSGNGIDLSEFSIYEYITIKHVNKDLSNDKRRIWWYPY